MPRKKSVVSVEEESSRRSEQPSPGFSGLKANNGYQPRHHSPFAFHDSSVHVCGQPSDCKAWHQPLASFVSSRPYRFPSS